MRWEIDREKITAAVVAMASTRPVRLSVTFLRLWCGWDAPTEDLQRNLAEHGIGIVPGGDHHGGWEVSKARPQGGLF